MAPCNSEEHTRGESRSHAPDEWNAELEMIYGTISHLFISHSTLKITLNIFEGKKQEKMPNDREQTEG